MSGGRGKDDINDDPPVGVLAEILMAWSVKDVDAQVIVIESHHRHAVVVRFKTTIHHFGGMRKMQTRQSG